MILSKMKKHKKAIAVLIALVFVAVIISGILSEAGSLSEDSLKTHKDYIKSFESEDDSSWTQVDVESESALILEKNGLKLDMDLKTTRFVVENEEGTLQYTSFPTTEVQMMSEEDVAKNNSNIGLSYYDDNNKLNFMGAYKDSVSKGQYKVFKKDNKVRVIYEFGSSADKLLAPTVISAETMNDIFSSIKAFEAAKLKLYYKVYSEKSDQENYDDMLKKYPGIKGKEVYILSQEVSEDITKEISAFFIKGGLTKEKIEEEAAELNIQKETDNLPVGFTVPLELTLDSNGFVAKILTDRILENNKHYKLVNISLLEYFGAEGKEAEGFFLVPDGSGSKIELNQQEPQNYTQHFYNDDLLIKTNSSNQFFRNAPLPYFAQSVENSAFFAVVEEGAAVGSVKARTLGQANLLNTINVNFDVRAVDKTDIGKDRNIPTLNIYSGHITHEHLSVKYILLPKSENIIFDMSEAYRAILNEKNVVEKAVADNENIPLYLDFICMSTESTKLAGISYEKPVVLSTLSEITEIVNRLYSEGITNLNIRLKGWTEQGIKQSAFENANLSKKIGTSDQLIKLNNLLKEKGGSLALDTDFGFAKTNQAFDSLVFSRDTSRNLEKSIASLKELDNVTLNNRNVLREGYIVSPYAYIPFAESFLKSFEAQKFNDIKLSWGAGGAYLTADYNVKTDIDMAYAANVSKQVFSKLNEFTHKPIVTDYGYDYILPYVTDIINTPLTPSGFSAQTEAVPFMQMVLSGIKNYSGPALNITGTRAQLAEMASTGAAPYYLLMTKNDKAIKTLALQQRFYSLEFTRHLEDIVKSYKEYQNVVGEIFNEKIVSFSWLDGEVSKTGFENGKTITVNRSKDEKIIGELKLPPFSYVME